MIAGATARRLRPALALLVGVVAAGSASAQRAPAVEWRPVGAGVEWAQFNRYADAAGEPAGPWAINALRLDLTQVRLDVVRALDAAVGLETVSSLAERHGAIAAINGGYFRTTGTFRGDSTGVVQIDGALLSEPDRGRAAIGVVRVGDTTRLVFGHVEWDAKVEVGGRVQTLDGVNRAPGDNEIVVFTPEFHRTTLTRPGGVEAIVRNGAVSEVRPGKGSTAIPPDGFVLSITGSRRTWARESLRPGTPTRVTMTLKPSGRASSNPWPNAEDVLGAGPKLVTAGRLDVTIEREKMQPDFATDRHPRTALAELADGRALLVVVDGRQPLRSVGMSLEELGQLLIEMGAFEAVNLDGGGSTTMVVEGKVVNRPSDASGERPVSDALLVRRVGREF